MSEFSERGLFAPPPRRLYSIDPTDNFLHQLALGAIASVETADPFALADMTIFLPTRRAVRGLIDAFADVTSVPEQSGIPNDPKTDKSDGRALLLPQIVSIGDIDDTETLEIDTMNGGIESAAIAPPISTTERLIVLARLVAAKEKAFSGNDSWPAVLAAARELSALLDSFYTEEIPLSTLATAVPPEHAAHWQQSLSFLEIVAEAWPAYLRERGLSDPSEYRAAVIAQRAQALRDHPPTSPVLVAGTTASAPSVARLVDAVSLAPKGAAVLPGLDRHLNKKAWASVDDGHPQAGLKALLQKLDCEPESVLRWPTQDNVRPRSSEGIARQRVFSISLRPAEATDDWFDLSKSVGADVGAAIQNLEIVEAANEDAEAAAIAICLRQAIEQPASTAMLVTPDRSLARRVSAKMTRWGVSVDDSAGAELPSTPLGTFLLLLAKFLSTPDDAVAFLSLIDHPLTDKRDLSEDTISGIDLALRGPLPSSKTPGSFTTVRKRIEQSLYEQSGEGTDTDKSIDAWLDRFDNSTRQWPRTAEFSTYLEVHSQIVERLAVSGEDPSAVWSGDSGISAASLMSDVMGSMANAGSPTVSRSEYPAAFHAMAAGVTIRSRRLTHPRIQILGPLEARLQHADLTILGGLNEGVWPSDAAVGAFLSRGMRESLGLQSPERKIGLAAHDFSQLAAKPTVILTRATKAADGPTKPSRWLLRLQNLLAGLDSLSVDNAGPALSKTIETGAKYAEWSRQLLSNGMGADQGTPLSSPSPTPPVSARPRKMSVTKIEK
ncbi:MAG: double-strand break repair protein AddB, partial [Pseudomonadota bacterium]